VNGVGEPIRDDTFLILLNPHHEAILFYMPADKGSSAWEVVIDSAKPQYDGKSEGKVTVGPGKTFELIPRSTALLREVGD
jgi:glycogen operon protein